MGLPFCRLPVLAFTAAVSGSGVLAVAQENVASG